ncbi:MAG: thiamine diphosphokinase [Deltaproteobacteria bacterium RIFOXYC2_FULL_48_10]|nr:MAG: thiamine diphosphokinase [Deltaproteobacteria bacterium RIFOXYC2_FULL_48_10]
MKCVIIANGDLEYSEKIIGIIQEAGLAVCADGGIRHLKALGLLPHIIIGDFDSALPEDTLYFKEKKIKFISHPSRKNETDTDLCISWALLNHATDITLLGATGTRLDHTLANVFLLKKLAGLGIPARIIDKHNTIHVVTDQIELKGRPGDLLSLLPVTEKAAGITIKGVEYPLVDATLEMGSSLGISNVFKETTVLVSVREGILMVIQSKD